MFKNVLLILIAVQLFEIQWLIYKLTNVIRGRSF